MANVGNYILILSLLFFNISCSLNSTNDNGRTYLQGLAAGWEPVYEYSTTDKYGEAVYHLKYSLGKGYFLANATGREIEKARKQNPKLSLNIDVVNDALLSSEFAAKSLALQHSKLPERPVEWFLQGTVPQVPAKFKHYEEKWRWAWKRGFIFNYKRYYAWYKKGRTNTIQLYNKEACKRKASSTVKEGNNKYDSGWMLYEPGEFKYLQHNLNLSHDQMIVNVQILKAGNVVSANSDLLNLKGINCSVTTPTTIKVQRLYKDTETEAIRVQINIKR